MQRVVCLLAVTCGMLAGLCTGSAQTEKRVALVIGNSAYRHVAALINPANDASDMAAALARLGFSITKVENAGFDTMRRALLDFGRRARAAEMAVVYFAGHGIEVGGENYLIAVDAEIRADIDADNEAIGLKNVMLTVAGATRLGLVILDACRNNPFAARMQRTVRSRSVDRGLARVEPTGSILIAYAARDGTTAADGPGRNSPFTGALLRHIETPGLEINFLFRRVRDDVLAATGRTQEPYTYGALSGEPIYFTAALISPSAGIMPAPPPVALSPPAPAIVAPNEPLPNNINVDPHVLRLVETHAFFANAPALKIRKYARSEIWSMTYKGSASKVLTDYETLVRQLRPGLIGKEKTYTSSNKTTHREMSVDAANGFISLESFRH